MSFPKPFHRWRPHPWHGLDLGPEAPDIVQAYIELTPFDLVKYEIDKENGYLRVDRPQRTSSQPPSLYGFVPRTYCGDRVRDLMPGADRGDGDPLDICVLSERPIERVEIIVKARIVGGLPMLDDGEADDKIVAVLVGDFVWSEVREIDELPAVLVERLRHYFSTYKMVPTPQPGPKAKSNVTIGEPYGREHALHIIRAAASDYADTFG